tara:strand:- start:3092 stop:5212 length:2121 start_codon:yes stop_codon:yes gene_type:complete
MKNFSLRFKVIVVGVLPMVCFIALSLINFFNHTRSLSDAKTLENKMDLIEAASDVVHETQKERGKTALYLNGGSKFAPLSSQRELNDKKIQILESVLQVSQFDEEYKKIISDNILKISDLRKEVELKKINTAKALSSYSEIVKTFLDIQLETAKSSSLVEISSELQTLRALEEAKESGGKLRATMSGILAANKPIDEKKFFSIINLKAGVEEGVKNPGLDKNKKSIELVKDFKNSKEWKTVNNTFELILKNSEKGAYYQDSSEFFNVITVALNKLGSLITHHKGVIRGSIDSSKNESFSSILMIGILSFLSIVVVSLIMYIVTRSISQGILNISSRLIKSSQDVSVSSETMASISSQLSDSATMQASSLQQTVSSIDEISSMVQKNADSAMSSTKVSEKSTEAASIGKKKIDSMIVSIKDISKSNDAIMEEMENNNAEISKIVDVISKIAEKTTVINDIVFQTKLLSFNASVEAARAGEHGKGFAVVAEEVGNLASMSGNAALEITEMLETSTKQVKDIVEKSKGKIESLVKEGKVKVDSGTQTAIECGESLEEILQNVGSVNEMVREISSASAEQSEGVKEVTKAMQNLDQVSHQNTAAANDSSETARKLKDQSSGLQSAVEELVRMVNGSNSTTNNNKVSSNVSHQKQKVTNIVEFKSKPSKKVKENVKSNKIIKRENSKVQELKVVGMDSGIPSENDPRFEDL